MKALKVALVFILVVNAGWSLLNWLSPDPEPMPPLAPPAQTAMVPADTGLDLPALVGLTKEIRSGQELERRLNEKDGINNLDLDANQKVDYLQVEEFGQPTEGAIGYSVFTEPAKDQRQEVAEVTVQKNGDRAEIQVIGNEQIYGTDAIYNDWAPVEREVAQTGQSAGSPPYYPSYFMPHPLWISPFGFGYYPPYFSFFPILGPSMYMSRVTHYRSGVAPGANRHQATQGKALNNPNKGKSADQGVKRSLKRPTSTQRQFQASSRRNVGSGGFGQTKARASAPSSSRPALGQGSSGGFGRNSGSSFGRSSGVSSPLRSPSTRSRSFSFGGK
ncbi:MAG: hypothetical protein RRB13_08010 [bacterium]|nr:hypothetical protein [bacterium]